MSRSPHVRVSAIFGVICLAFLASTGLALAEKSPFTVADSLKVKSFSAQAMTDDGRYLTGTISQRLGRLGTDHKRYRDPTYISPRPADLVILDSETGDMDPVFKEKIQVQGLTWSPDGKTLAFLLRVGNGFTLQTYDREKKRLREIRLKTDLPISSNSFLIWKNDGEGILLALRAEGWEERSRTMFTEATVGPIIVYDSREPFLKWDVLRDQALLQIPAAVDLGDGAVRELLPEGRYSGIRLSEDDSFLAYVETYPMKTEYGQNYYRQGGREYALFRLDLAPGAEPKALIERDKKQLSLRWNEENTAFAWADEGDIFVRSVDEAEARNLTKDKVTPEEAGEKKEEEEKGAEEAKGEDKKPQKVRFSLQRWSPDGTKLLAGTKKGYWLIDLESGGLEMVYTFPEEEDEDDPRNPRQSVAEWTPDGRYLYLTYAARDKWERGFTRYDLESRRMEDLVIDSNLYRGLQMSKDGGRFFFSFSDGRMLSSSALVRTGGIAEA